MKHFIFTDQGPVSSLHEDIAEIIQDYDSELWLAWIPPTERAKDEPKPWAVIHRPEGKPEYVVATFAECDHRILAYLWNNDLTRTNVLADIEAQEAALKAIQLKQDLDTAAENADVALHVLRSPKSRYSAHVNGRKVTFE